MIVLQAFAVAAGAALIVSTLLSALQTMVMPRAAPTAISRMAFIGLRLVFNIRASERRSYEQRDEALALYAPLALFLLPAWWLVLVLAGFTAIFWGLGVSPLQKAFSTSGSSLLTLGFERPEGMARLVVSFVESALGPALVAILVSYLPTIYAAFSRRETSVTLLETYSGAPASPIELLVRARRISGLDALPGLWREWMVWFADLEESHSSIGALSYFRSPRASRSWVSAAGCVLDAASLYTACLAVPKDGTAPLCIRSGYLALRHVGSFFRIPFDPNPTTRTAISIGRDEFDAAWDELARAGVPLVDDREKAWDDFRGWRVNYDAVLVELAGLTVAAPSLWTGDRAAPYQRPPLKRIFFGR